MGFGTAWRGWIRGCLEDSTGSVLVNGSPTKEFCIRRGLRQGDPLSPFLFILAMEGLHVIIQDAVSKNIFRSASIGNDRYSLSHLFYADDAIFLGEWSLSNARNIIRILRCFHLISGLKINLQKSKLFGVGVGPAKIDHMASSVGCSGSKPPFSYLGLPVGGNMSKTEGWKVVFEKFQAKLSNWKVKTLSVGGRVTLLKSVLGNLPTYLMSIYKVPSSVVKGLESLRNRFFIGGDAEENKMSWVKWSKAMAGRNFGGLGIGSIMALNRALIFKWIWRFWTQNEALWVKIIKSIYGMHGRIGSNLTRQVPNSTWVSILKSTTQLKNKGIDLFSFCKKNVSDGSLTSFWDDVWVGESPLKVQFPRVYALELDKLANVKFRLEAGCWDVWLRREPRGGVEEAQFRDLQHTLASVILSGQLDRWVWTLEGSGEYSVTSARVFIYSRHLEGEAQHTRWNSLIPIKVNVFAWRLSLNRLPTRSNLDKRGIDIAYLLCPNCGTETEDCNHLFFSCHVAKDIWILIGRWWQMDIPNFDSLSEWGTWIDSIRLKKEVFWCLEAVMLITMWSIWVFRNGTLFSDPKPKKSAILENIITRAYFWVNHRSRKLSINWVGWLTNPSLAIIPM